MMRLGAFKVDCTPPVGCSAGFGTGEPTSGVRDPLWLRGFVLDDGRTRCVIASLDYCGLMNRAQDELVSALAEATGAPRDCVVVHCIHQHDAPIINFEIEPYLGCDTFPKEWWSDLLGACALSARESGEGLIEVAEVGRGEVRLHGYASNRRILGEDGKVKGMRYSRCGNEELKQEPVGVIDPMLRTVAFRDASRETIATMSFYATHPQVSSSGKVFSAEAQGEAMRLLGEKMPDGHHAFFTGPGGNVTAGKYSSPTDLEGNLLHFGKLLADGIELNLRAMQWEPVNALRWDAAAFPFPRQAIDRDAALAKIRDDQLPVAKKIAPTAVLTAHDYEGNASYRYAMLRLGSVRMLFLPGELFVEYQLYAQSLLPDEFVAIAANCGDSFLYLPLARSFEEGGYEPTQFCWCTEEFESRLKEALSQLLLGS